MRLVPAPRGTRIVAPFVAKKILHLAGVNDVYTFTSGATKTTVNYVKATYNALAKIYCYLTPDLWKPDKYIANPFEAHQEFLRTDQK